MKPFSLIVLAACLLLMGCKDEQQRPVPKFKEGDIVEFVISDQRAQIISVHEWKEPAYDVRMVAPQIFTNTHLFRKDGPLTTETLARINYVHEYELRPAK